MKKWIKIAMFTLVILTVSFISVSYGTHVSRDLFIHYGDLRDYYPYGLWIEARRLTEQPETWVELENDTYIAQAINKTQVLTFEPINPEYNWTKRWIQEGWVWIQQDDPNSEFMKKGTPAYILWIPDENYYFIHLTWVDGTPESFKYLPPPEETAALLSIPWAVLIGMAVKYRQRNN